MTVVGIDASLSATAVVVVHENLMHNSKLFKQGKPAKLIDERMANYNDLISGIVDYIEAFAPSVVCIESYAFGSKRGVTLAEFGGLLRFELFTMECQRYEVAPTTLKKFVAGHGQADKAVVAASIMKRWDAGFSTNDEFDAYGLARIAAMIAKMDKPTNQLQIEALETVTRRSWERTLTAITEDKQHGKNGNAEESKQEEIPF